MMRSESNSIPPSRPISNRWFLRASSRFFALCWMLAAYLAVGLPMMSVPKASACQPYTTGGVEEEEAITSCFFLGQEVAPGVRNVRLMYSIGQQPALFSISLGHIYSVSTTLISSYTPASHPWMFTPGTAAGPGTTLVPHSMQFREFAGTFMPEDMFVGDAFPIQSFVEVITWTDNNPGFVELAPMLTIGTGGDELEAIRQQALQPDLSGITPIQADSEREVCGFWAVVGGIVAVVGGAIGVITYVTRNDGPNANQKACIDQAHMLRDNCIDGMLNQGNYPSSCAYQRGACCYEKFKKDEQICTGAPNPPPPIGGIASNCLSIVCP